MVPDFDLRSTNLKASSFRGGVVTLAFQGIDVVIRVASIAILARALLPADFGLVAMVTAITAIAEQFKDIGLSTATIQRKTISHEQLSNLFWINLGAGLAIAAILSAGSLPIATFFHDNRLVYVTIAVASGFAWTGAAIQHQALLRRQMKYTTIGAIQVAASVISTGIALSLAFHSHSYWALVWREVLRNVLVALGTWLSCPWLPGLPRKRIDVDDLLRFGRHVTAFNMIVFLAASADQVLIGRFYGPVLLGFYRQAYQLVVWPVMQFTVPLSRVSESTLSFLQDSPERYRHAYRRLVTTLSLAMMPFLLFAAIHAHDIVLLVLGPKWLDAVPIFRVLALAVFIRPVSDSTGLLLITSGRSRRYMLLGVATGLILLTSYSIGAIWGPLGVAYGALAATYSLFALRLLCAFRDTPVTVSDFLHAITTPLLASVAMALSSIAIDDFLTTTDPWTLLVIALPASIAIYFMTLLMLPGGTHTLRSLAADVSASLHFKSPSTPFKAAHWKGVLWWQR